MKNNNLNELRSEVSENYKTIMNLIKTIQIMELGTPTEARITLKDNKGNIHQSEHSLYIDPQTYIESRLERALKDDRYDIIDYVEIETDDPTEMDLIYKTQNGEYELISGFNDPFSNL